MLVNLFVNRNYGVDKSEMTKIVSNRKQLNRLVELMEQSPDVAKGFCSKTGAQAKWEQLATELNSLGPPERDWQKWQRVWIDLKCKIKKKVENKVKISASSGDANQSHQFNDMEDAMIRILELKTCVDPPGNEFEIDEPDSELKPSCSQLSFLNDFADSAEKPTAQRKTKATPRVDDLQRSRMTLLEEQTSAQKEFYDSMTNIMSYIQRSMTNIEFYSMKKCQQEQKHNTEILKLKTEKLKLCKQNEKNKDNHRKAKLKLETETLEFKKQIQHLRNLKGVFK